MTSIFSRFRDIVSSNINSMLDKAEDPEKLAKLMIAEMENTLVEIKASCAGAMAENKRVARALEESKTKADDWAGKAELAVNKGRENLGREALLEKRYYLERANYLKNEAEGTQEIINQYQNEIFQLEEKLASAREKQRLLVQRHIQAQGKKKVREEIRYFDANDALMRFEQFENRIERMESEADLVDYGRQPLDLADEFVTLERDEGIEQELDALKAKRDGQEHLSDK